MNITQYQFSTKLKVYQAIANILKAANGLYRLLKKGLCVNVRPLEMRKAELVARPFWVICLGEEVLTCTHHLRRILYNLQHFTTGISQMFVFPFHIKCFTSRYYMLCCVLFNLHIIRLKQILLRISLRSPLFVSEVDYV